TLRIRTGESYRSTLTTCFIATIWSRGCWGHCGQNGKWQPMSTDDVSIINPRPPDKGSAVKGFLYGIAVNVGIFILCLPWAYVLVYSLGVIPLAVIVPMIFSFRGKQETATAKGL